MTLDYGNYGIFLLMGNVGFISLNPKPKPPIDPLKELRKGSHIDPFKGTLGFISSIIVGVFGPQERGGVLRVF